MAHVLYRFYDTQGRLLYIGITLNPPQRFKDHRKHKDWWSTVADITLETYDTRAEVAAAEREAIQTEHPLYNIVHAKPATQTPLQAVRQHAPLGYIETGFSGGFGLAALFPNERRQTYYGYLTQDEYARALAADRAKWEAIAQCQLCDDTGYRNLYLCNHSARTGHLKAAMQRVRQERFELVKGGAN